MQQRLPSLLDPPIAFAHRGARAHAPENTLDAFALALKLGASGLESDVWLTADGIPVLDHDGVVGTRLRRRPIAEVPRHALPSHIPSLAELLEACGTDFELSLDICDPQAAAPVVATVRAIDDSMLPRVWLCDPDLERLAAWRAGLAEVKLVNSTRLTKLKEGPERRAARLAELGIDAMNMHHSDWNGGLVALFHRFGRLALGWDMQFEHVLRPAIRMGLDGVFGDHVDVMVQAFLDEVGEPPTDPPA